MKRLNGVYRQARLRRASLALLVAVVTLAVNVVAGRERLRLIVDTVRTSPSPDFSPDSGQPFASTGYIRRCTTCYGA